MKRGIKITHRFTTTLVCLLIGASTLTYILRYEDVSETFVQELHFPSWLVYPMAIAKIAAIIMLISKFNKTLTEWAYAGLAFNMLLAVGAQLSSGDSQFIYPTIAVILVFGSYFSWKKMLGWKEA